MNRQLPILLADDDPDDLFHLTRVLRKLGLTNVISVVNSGGEAIAYVTGSGRYADREQHPFPSVIIIDIRMEPGSGLDFLRWLREHSDYAIIPAIVLSGSAFPDEVTEAYRMGANCYLKKPNSPPELEAMLKVCVEFWAMCEKPAYNPHNRQPSDR